MKEQASFHRGWLCCPQMQSAIEGAGQRGISVLIERLGTTMHFVLQSRGVAHVDEGAIPFGAKLTYTVNVSASWGILFCPWCGRDLMQLIEDNPAEVEQLAVAHQPLLGEISRRLGSG